MRTRRTMTILVVLVMLVVIPLVVVPIDATSILENPESARVQVGDILQIDSRGRGAMHDGSDQARVLVKMHLEFQVASRLDRGVSFVVLQGYLVMNNSQYAVVDGRGAAGRTNRVRLNITISFVFRINMTGPDGEPLTLRILGGVKRTESHGPVLVMRSLAVIDGVEYVLWQLGRAHR